MAYYLTRHAACGQSRKLRFTSQTQRGSRENKQGVEQGYNSLVCPVRTSPRKAALSIGPITFPIRLPTEKQVFIHKTMRRECFSFKQRIAKQVCVLNNEKYAFYRSVFQGVVYRLVSFRSLKSFGYVQWSRGYWFILIFGNY